MTQKNTLNPYHPLNSSLFLFLSHIEQCLSPPKCQISQVGPSISVQPPLTRDIETCRNMSLSFTIDPTSLRREWISLQSGARLLEPRPARLLMLKVEGSSLYVPVINKNWTWHRRQCCFWIYLAMHPGGNWSYIRNTVCSKDVNVCPIITPSHQFH